MAKRITTKKKDRDRDLEKVYSVKQTAAKGDPAGDQTDNCIYPEHVLN